MIKKVGVLTSGGDAPGMNAALRAVVRSCWYYGMEAVGIKRGYDGLLNEDFAIMPYGSVSDILELGGTILQTARSTEFATPEGVKKGAEICKKNGIDALVVIGGDGSFRGALDLSKKGIAVIGIPGTIDNDIGCSEYTIGFDTAVNTAIEAVDKLRDTASSHQRCSIVEVMGRRAGYIALHTGIACGAEAVLIPEKPLDLERDLLEPILKRKKEGKTHFIVVVAEGLEKTKEIEEYITEKIGLEVRTTVLGHIQRGGSPSAVDRVTGSEMGAFAVRLLKNGKINRVVARQNGKIVDIDIEEALKMKKSVDEEMLVLLDELTK